MGGCSASQPQSRGHGIFVVGWYAPSCEYHQTREKPCPKFLPHILVGAGLEWFTGREANRRTAKFLERDHRFVPLLIIIHDDLLIATLTDNEARVTPTEVVHTPEGIDRKEETIHGVPRMG